MATSLIAEIRPQSSRQRFGLAYCAALVVVLYLKAIETMVAPDGFGAALWLHPFSFILSVGFVSLCLAPVALLNENLLRFCLKKWASRWGVYLIAVVCLAYGIVLLSLIHLLAASSGLPGMLYGVCSVVVPAVLYNRFQHMRHRYRLIIPLIAVTAIVPLYLLLRPVPDLKNIPIIWVQNNPVDDPKTPSQVYWQPGRYVCLQWHGKNYRLDGMSPAFAFWQHQLITLEGRELVVTPLSGTPRQISLRPYLPNYYYILNIQPTLDGVMLNVYAPNRPQEHSVLRVNLRTQRILPVHDAWRVRGAEQTDHYDVMWSNHRPHQVRDGRDRIVRQHGLYPHHFADWDADPVDDVFAIYGASTVNLLASDSITQAEIVPHVPITSVTMQPGQHQLWIAEKSRYERVDTEPACRLVIYAYNGRPLGERTLIGADVTRALPVEESMVRLLLKKYIHPALKE